MKKIIISVIVCIACNICYSYPRVFPEDYGYHHHISNGLSVFIVIIILVFLCGLYIGSAGKRKKKKETAKKTKTASKEHHIVVEETPLQRKQREQAYIEAMKKYAVEKEKYDKEMTVYNEAMKIRKKFTHGGKMPGCMGEIVKTIIYFLFIPCNICLFAWLIDISPKIVKIVLCILVIPSFWYGYKIINNKLGYYFQNERFDEKAFEKWRNKNPNSPYTRYIINNWPPSEPIHPTF